MPLVLSSYFVGILAVVIYGGIVYLLNGKTPHRKLFAGIFTLLFCGLVVFYYLRYGGNFDQGALAEINGFLPYVTVLAFLPIVVGVFFILRRVHQPTRKTLNLLISLLLLLLLFYFSRLLFTILFAGFV